MTLWLRGLTESRDKLKSLFFHYHSSYGHQTWRDANLLLRTPANKFTWSFDLVVLQDHMANSNHYIFTTTVPMVTKPEKLVTCHEGLLPIMILHPLVTWFCKIMWQTKTIFYLLPQNLCPQNLAGWWLNLTAFYPQSQMTNHVVLWDHVTN